MFFVFKSMRILSKDIKHGTIKLLVQGADDLWHLSQIIDPGDLVGAQTERKLKLGGSENSTSVKRTFFITIKSEKVEYDEGTKQLRILGTTQGELEEVPKGSYQTIEARPGLAIEITKEHWLGFQLARLDEAAQEIFSDTLVCLADRENAIIAILKSHGYEVLVELSGDVQKKYDGKMQTKEFYPEVVRKLVEYNSRFSLSTIIIASPAFWKEELIKEIKDELLRKKIKTATVNTVDRSGLEEVLKDPLLTAIIGEDRATKEAMLMEDFLKHLSTDGLCSYGEPEVQKAADMGAIKLLLLSSGFVSVKRAEDSFAPIDQLMKRVDATSGEVFILNSKNDPGKRLDALGGVCAILRFGVSFNS